MEGTSGLKLKFSECQVNIISVNSAKDDANVTGRLTFNSKRRKCKCTNDGEVVVKKSRGQEHLSAELSKDVGETSDYQFNRINAKSLEIYLNSLFLLREI